MISREISVRNTQLQSHHIPNMLGDSNSSDFIKCVKVEVHVSKQLKHLAQPRTKSQGVTKNLAKR